MTSAPALSVIICSHNPRSDYLARTLNALRSQTLGREQWELIVIDNASKDPLSGRLELSWHDAARVVREETLGLTPARLRGIREARGQLLVFVDDDNVLDSDYLEQASRLACEMPFLGAWSGQCRAEFEQPPPDWTRRYWGNLCVRVFDHALWSNLPRLSETMPAGAGLCVRQGVGQVYLGLHDCGERSFQFDRAGTSLISGGDNDLAACACRLGLGVGIFPELGLRHLIPPQRLTKDYLTRLAEGIAFSSTMLDAEWNVPVTERGPFGHLIDFLRTRRLKSPDREILRAFFKGRNEATKLVAANSRAKARRASSKTGNE